MDQATFGTKTRRKVTDFDLMYDVALADCSDFITPWTPQTGKSGGKPYCRGSKLQQ
jgi:hypothetical protein